MNKVIITQREDGSCSVTIPAPAMFDPNSRDRKNLENKGITFDSDEAVLDWIKSKDAPTGTVIDRSVLPDDRYFRNAWTHRNNTLEIDRLKAEAIHMNKLRLLRNEKLAALDTSYIKADEKGDNKTKADIAAKKQTLRDMPQTIDLSSGTLDELKNIMPDILK